MKLEPPKDDVEVDAQKQLAHQLTSEKSREEFSEIRAAEKIPLEKWRHLLGLPKAQSIEFFEKTSE